MKETNGIFELDNNDFVIVAGSKCDEYAVVVCDRTDPTGLKIVKVGPKILFNWLEKNSNEHPIDIIVKIASPENDVHLCAPIGQVAACISENKDGEDYHLDIQLVKFNFLENNQELNNNQKKQEPQYQMEMNR